MARQGCVFSEREIQNIVHLLNTEMTVGQIAERMGCSRSAIVNINRKFNIRVYAGRRTSWQKTEDAMAESINDVA
jgi:GTP-sensing pleiotropic transcriptional regulator CodY